jgi:anaerobic selenocysteine-containing dehydrogenase
VRGVVEGQMVVVENGRGSVRLRAVVTDGVRRGVVVSPKGRWGNVEGGQVNGRRRMRWGFGGAEYVSHEYRVGAGG